MNEIELTYREFYIYVIIGGAILGALFGLIPLLLGRKRGKARLGTYGFIASIVSGAIAPLFGLIVAAIFFWLVIRENPTEAGPASNGSSTDHTDSSSE